MAMSEAASASDIASAIGSMKSLRLRTRKSTNQSSRNGSTASTNESHSGSSRPSVSEPARRKSSMVSIPSRFWRSKKTKEDKSDGIVTDNSPTFGQRFFELPTEIQVAVLAYLDTKELLDLRQTSKRCLSIFQANASSIARNAFTTDGKGISAQFMIELYPPLFSSGQDDGYLLRMLRRERLLRRQLDVLLTFIQTRVYMLRLTAGLPSEHFAPYRNGIYRTLYQPVGLMQHLLEANRYLIVHAHPHHLSPRLTVNLCPACMASIKKTIESYPTDQLIPLYHTLQLILQHFRTATRTPSSVTPFERKIRGWSYGPPPDEHMSQFVLLGCMSELSKVNEMHGSYAKRLGIVKAFCDTISEAVKYNSSTLDDFFQTEHDPVLGNKSRNTGPVTDKRQAKAGGRDLRLGLEACANESRWGVVKSLDVSMDALTVGTLKSVPSLESIMFGPQAVIHQRIIELELVGRPTDLFSPYQYVRELMSQFCEPPVSQEQSGSAFVDLDSI